MSSVWAVSGVQGTRAAGAQRVTFGRNANALAQWQAHRTLSAGRFPTPVCSRISISGGCIGGGSGGSSIGVQATGGVATDRGTLRCSARHSRRRLCCSVQQQQQNDLAWRDPCCCNDSRGVRRSSGSPSSFSRSSSRSSSSRTRASGNGSTRLVVAASAAAEAAGSDDEGWQQPLQQGWSSGEEGEVEAEAAAADEPAAAAAAAAVATPTTKKTGRRKRDKEAEDGAEDGGGGGDDVLWQDEELFLSWDWDRVARQLWSRGGLFADEMARPEDYEAVREWYAECRRYWLRDGRLDGKTVRDVVEVLRRWELDASEPVFETVMSPEMAFALESVEEGKDETLVDMAWMDTLTPRGIAAANRARGMQLVAVGGDGEGGSEGLGRDASGLGVAGSVGLPTDSDGRPMVTPKYPEEWMGKREVVIDMDAEEVEDGEGREGSSRATRVEGSWSPQRAFELVPPRDWPPPGWSVDKRELAFIHGAHDPELERLWRKRREEEGEDGGVDEGEEEEEEESPRWRAFMKQYEEWVEANRSRLALESAVADPIYYPGRRRRGHDYDTSLLELPMVEVGQLYFGRVTMTHLVDGAFVHIGAVHDGWVPVYHDDWFHVRQILRINTPVLVQVTAKRDPFRYRFPIELRLIDPNIDRLVWRKQKYPPHAPIFAREGDHNLDELAMETGRPLLPLYNKVYFANFWERLFVKELEADETAIDAGTHTHPYMGHLKRVEEVEQLLLSRQQRGETITRLTIHQMLPQVEDAALVNLELAAMEEQQKQEARELAAQQELLQQQQQQQQQVEGEEGEELQQQQQQAPVAVAVPPTRFDRLRSQLSDMHAQREREETEALARDTAMRKELGLPLAEPGRTPTEVIHQIGKKAERYNLLAFLFTAIDLQLFGRTGIPDEFRAQRDAAGGDSAVEEGQSGVTDADLVATPAAAAAAAASASSPSTRSAPSASSSAKQSNEKMEVTEFVPEDY